MALRDRLPGHRDTTEYRVVTPPQLGGDVNGITLADGTYHPLEGQPPVAQSKGWGNLAFLRRGLPPR